MSTDTEPVIRLSPEEYLDRLTGLTEALLAASSGAYIKDSGHLVQISDVHDDDDGSDSPFVIYVALDLLEDLIIAAEVHSVGHPKD